MNLIVMALSLTEDEFAALDSHPQWWVPVAIDHQQGVQLVLQAFSAENTVAPGKVFVIIGELGQLTQVATFSELLDDEEADLSCSEDIAAVRLALSRLREIIGR